MIARRKDRRSTDRVVKLDVHRELIAREANVWAKWLFRRRRSMHKLRQFVIWLRASPAHRRAFRRTYERLEEFAEESLERASKRKSVT